MKRTNFSSKNNQNNNAIKMQPRIPLNATYCYACGALNARNYVCPKCHEEYMLFGDNKYCFYCGTPITSSHIKLATDQHTIMQIVSLSYNIKSEEIKSKKRDYSIVLARQVYMYICNNLTSLSLEEIGKTIGGLNHTSIKNGISRICVKIDQDDSFAEEIKSIMRKIQQR